MLQKFLVIVLLYFYFYNPVFVLPGFGFVIILMAFSILYAVLKWRVVKSYINFYRTELVLSIIMLIYVTTICALKGTEQIGVNIFLWIIITVFVPIFLIETVLSKQKEFVFGDVVIQVGFIASVFSCVALFYPPFNFFLRSIQVSNELTDYAESQSFFRFYGLAINLSSAYGYMQGLVAALCLLKLDKTHKRYALYFLTLVISVFVNARTGIVPVFLTIIYLIMNFVVKFKVGKLLKTSILAIFALYAIISTLKLLPDVNEFVIDFFDQISLMLFEEDDGFKNSAYFTMLKFPESLVGIIFGEGHSIYGIGAGDSSDIGYVNQIFIGGLVFALLLVIYEIVLYVKIRNRSGEIVYSTIFFFSILIFNYKGFNFYDSGAYIKLWMLYYFILVHNRMAKKSVTII